MSVATVVCEGSALNTLGDHRTVHYVVYLGAGALELSLRAIVGAPLASRGLASPVSSRVGSRARLDSLLCLLQLPVLLSQNRAREQGYNRDTSGLEIVLSTNCPWGNGSLRPRKQLSFPCLDEMLL